jgi:hypothetical protein
MKKLTWLLIAFLLVIFSGQAWAVTGTTTSNGFLYKPPLGARGATAKGLFDVGLDRVDARLGKEIWVGDPNYGTTFQTALTAIGSNNVILRVPAGTHNIAADMTSPANVTLKPQRGAVFAVATGKTLTINKLEAGPYQIFSCTGTGKVVFGPGAVQAVHPEWWGADPTGTSDSLTAFTAAATAMNFVSSANGSSSVIGLEGSPGATYLLSAPVTFKPLSAYKETPVKVDGHGATVKMMGVGNDLFYLTGNYGPLEVCNWRFQGAAPFQYVWAASYPSLPAAVTFNGTAGTKKTSFAALSAAQQWYYDASTTTLYITSNTGYTNPNTTYTAVLADGNALTFTVPYEKGIGIKVSSDAGGAFVQPNIHNCWFADLDVGIQFNYVLFGKIDTVYFVRANKSLELKTLVGNCNLNSVTNVEASHIFGSEAIYVEDGHNNYFGNIDTEHIKYRTFYCKNTLALIIDNYHYEVVAQADDFAANYDHLLLFDGCLQTTIRSGMLWHETNVGLKAVLKLNGCHGFILDNCMLPDTVLTTVHDYIATPSSCLFTMGATASDGIEVRTPTIQQGCVLNFSGASVAKVRGPMGWRSPATGAVNAFTMPVSFLEYGSPVTEFCKQPIFAADPTHSETGCTAARDATVVYRGSNSWKISLSGADGDKHASLLSSFLTRGTGTKYSLLTVVYAADTDMNITFTVMGSVYSYYKGINVTGDSKWRAVCCFRGNGGTVNDNLEIQSSKGSGNLWIGEVRWNYFDTLAELLEYVGKIPVTP